MWDWWLRQDRVVRGERHNDGGVKAHGRRTEEVVVRRSCVGRAGGLVQ